MPWSCPTEFVHGRAVNLHSQAKPRLHRAILRWGGMAQLFSCSKRMRKMFQLVPAASSLLLLVSCASMHPDGDAVECSECRTFWVRLLADTAAPGLYVFGDERDKRRACSRCQELSVTYFESGVLPRSCAYCDGTLTPRAVGLSR